MAETQLIVERLNAPPFNENLSLVAFDEKSPFELLKLLNKVFAAMDKRHGIDLRDEEDEARTQRFMDFLHVLRFNGFPSQQNMEIYREALSAGERTVVYPILHWALASFSSHKKRAYLANFLSPLPIPQEYLQQDEALMESFEHFKSLQQQFKAVHKQVDQLKSGDGPDLSMLKKENSQLEDEKRQLKEKIANLQRKTESLDGFKKLLEATSSLRKEQEEQSKLMERQRDQRISLQHAEMKLHESKRRVAESRAAYNDEDAETLFARLQKEVEENRELVEHFYPEEVKEKQERLRRLEDLLNHPRSEDDLLELKHAVSQTEKRIEILNEKISSAQKALGDEKLAIFRQHATAAGKKVQKKQEQVEKVRQKLQHLQLLIEEKETELSAAAGPRFMRKNDFKKFAAELREKTAKYKELKTIITEMEEELMVLNRTESILKQRAGDVDHVLQKIEDKKGVTGYYNTQKELEKISEENAKINEAKGRTLDEISRIVSEITQTLKEKKTQLAPQIKELREVRAKFQQMEQGYLAKKEAFDSQGAGFEAEKRKLEGECEAFQVESLREESRFHYLNALSTIAHARNEKAVREQKFLNGEEKLLRDFPTYSSLYQHKIEQEEQLTKALRRKQKHIKENESGDKVQREMFQALQKVLQCKKVSVEEENTLESDPEGHEIENFAQFHNTQDTNVMSLYG